MARDDWDNLSVYKHAKYDASNANHVVRNRDRVNDTQFLAFIFDHFLALFHLHRQPPEIIVWTQPLQTWYGGRVLNCLHSQIKNSLATVAALKAQRKYQNVENCHF